MSESSLRVLVLGDARSFHLVRYVKGLKEQDCEVVVASLEDNPAGTHALKRRGWFGWLHYVLSSFEIRRLAKEMKPDIINPHFASGYGFAVSLASIRTVAPVVLHLWGSDILRVPNKSVFHRRKTSFALGGADLVLADSEYLIGAAKKLNPIRHHAVIPWGLEQKFLETRDGEFTLSKPLRIIIPRSHEQVYNNIFLLRTLAPLINEKKIVLTVPSFGSIADLFQAEAGMLVDNAINYYDKLPRAEFISLMSGQDVYISASLSDSSPVSLIEAMGLGLIPVCGDIPGIREWLGHENGILFDLNEPDCLLRGVSKIIDENNPMQQLRRYNIEQVKENGLFENNIKETIRSMHELIGNKNSK